MESEERDDRIRRERDDRIREERKGTGESNQILTLQLVISMTSQVKRTISSSSDPRSSPS